MASSGSEPTNVNPGTEQIDIDPEEFSPPGDREYDSDLGSSIASMTASLNSVGYVFENGRRYHRYSAGLYAMPNDEPEQDRLDFVHFLYILLFGGRLYLAPLEEPKLKRVLDLGTGTGLWVTEMAEKFPKAKIWGVDLSPIQIWSTPNVTFLVDDIENTWTYPENYFDYVHSRDMVQSIRNWPKLLSQAYSHITPGGYIELAENQCRIISDDGTVHSELNLMKYLTKLRQAYEEMGVKLLEGPELKQLLLDAGFVDIQTHTRKRPWGRWPRDRVAKEIGKCLQKNSFEAYGIGPFTRVLKMSAQEAADLCTAAWIDVSNPRVHGYNYVWRIVGRKPLDDEIGRKKAKIEEDSL